MKSISECYIDSIFEKYLLESLRISLLCLQKCSLRDYWYNIRESSEIFESLSQLDNFQKVHKIIRTFLQKLESDFEDKEYEIDLRKARIFCELIKINISHSDETSAEYYNISNNFKTVYINLNLSEHYKFGYDQAACSLILHELLHAYEDKCRRENGKKSIFDEFSEKYAAGFENINSDNVIIKNLGVLNYFLDSHEQRAYLSTLELDILNALDKINPSFEDMRTDKIFNEIKKSGIWKTYFEFGKFVALIDKIDDKLLERSYYKASKTRKTKIKDSIDKINALKEKRKLKDDYVKLANDIRKECKKVWKKFNKKFEETFIKVYANCL